MTLTIENAPFLKDLIAAAEKYAEAVKDQQYGEAVIGAAELVLRAQKNLAEAALEFAKWEKK